MENNTPFSDPATPASEAALTLLPSSNNGEGQNLVHAISTTETDIQLRAADDPPTVVQATTIVPAGAEVVPLPSAMGLSERQRIALRALAAGEGPGAAARAAGVNPGTLFRWRKYDPRFVAAYNNWQAESVKTAREYLAAANEHAARTVLNAVKAGDVRAALAVLRGMGTLAPRETGPAFAQLVERQHAKEFESIKIGFGKPSAEMQKELAQKQLEEKRLAEEAANKAARTNDQWDKFYRAYLQVPALARPVTADAIREAIKAWTGRPQIFTSRCCFAITAIAPADAIAREMLIGQLAEDQDMTGEAVEARLGSLPWVMKVVHSAERAEDYARLLESYGATIEIRPAWVE